MPTMIIEQTKEYPMRMQYDPGAGVFHPTQWEYLGHARGFTNPYGWLKESGTPPNPYLDVILISKKTYALGDELKIRIIGVFLRNDQDHKLVAVPLDRTETDIDQLPPEEMDELKRFYPRVDPGEGWFGKESAEHTIRGFGGTKSRK